MGLGLGFPKEPGHCLHLCAVGVAPLLHPLQPSGSTAAVLWSTPSVALLLCPSDLFPSTCPLRASRLCDSIHCVSGCFPWLILGLAPVPPTMPRVQFQVAQPRWHTPLPACLVQLDGKLLHLGLQPVSIGQLQGITWGAGTAVPAGNGRGHLPFRPKQPAGVHQRRMPVSICYVPRDSMGHPATKGLPWGTLSSEGPGILGQRTETAAKSLCCWPQGYGQQCLSAHEALNSEPTEDSTSPGICLLPPEPAPAE